MVTADLMSYNVLRYEDRGKMPSNYSLKLTVRPVTRLAGAGGSAPHTSPTAARKARARPPRSLAVRSTDVSSPGGQ